MLDKSPPYLCNKSILFLKKKKLLYTNALPNKPHLPSKKAEQKVKFLCYPQ